MRISKTFVGAMLVIAAAMSSSAALAHPGSKLLTTGSKNTPAAMSPGVSYEDINGVHIFRGRTLTPNTLLGSEPVAAAEPGNRDVKIIVFNHPWRSFRRLRTQGFYSGYAHPSRPYTQGFYSGHR